MLRKERDEWAVVGEDAAPKQETLPKRVKSEMFNGQGSYRHLAHHGFTL